MKKIIAIIVSAVMAFSAVAATSVTAMAANVSSPAAKTLQNDKVTITVNGENRQGGTYKVGTTDTKEVTFSYNGEGTLTGWKDNLESLGLVAGTDFTRTNNADGTYTIKFITDKAIDIWNSGTVIVDAVVDFGDETTTTEVPDSEENDETTTSKAKKNTSSKSPSTGVSTSLVAGTVAAAGAGFAVLAAMKKKEDK